MSDTGSPTTTLTRYVRMYAESVKLSKNPAQLYDDQTWGFPPVGSANGGKPFHSSRCVANRFACVPLGEVIHDRILAYFCWILDRILAHFCWILVPPYLSDLDLVGSRRWRGTQAGGRGATAHDFWDHRRSNRSSVVKRSVIIHNEYY